jgi:hypothetical protein
VFRRGFFVVLIDLALVFGAAYIAVGLKTDAWSLAAVARPVLEIATMLAPVTVTVFSWRGLYRGSWRVAGLQDLTRVLVAVAIATLVGALAIQLLSDNQFPPSLFVIHGVMSLLLTASSRASYVILEHSTLRSSHQGVPILIYGAGRRGAAAVRELFQHPASGLRPVGFIDDDRAMRGKIVSDLPVLGTSRELEHALEATGAGGILIAGDGISRHHLERATDVCQKRHASVFRLDVRVQRLSAGGEAQVAVERAASLSVPAPREARILALPSEPGSGDGQSCPSCRSADAHRSRARNVFERRRKERTPRRLYRCDACGWRGWLIPIESGHVVTIGGRATLDLGALDAAVRGGGAHTAATFPSSNLT